VGDCEFGIGLPLHCFNQHKMYKCEGVMKKGILEKIKIKNFVISKCAISMRKRFIERTSLR
jgi:hypothetical protein